MKKGSVSVLTLNAGLLDIKILGRHILEPAPFVEERISFLPKILARVNADIIALQEVYEWKHRTFLIEKLSKTYPYHFYSQRKHGFKLGNGLLFFSKYPIAQKKVFAFNSSILEEQLSIHKGVLIIKVNIDGLGSVFFYNFHTTAGGLRNPQNKSVKKVREEQVRQLIRTADESAGLGYRIILGDLNAGPEVAKENYSIFSQLHYIDAVTLKYGFSFTKKTWDPKNRLNIKGPHKDCPPQRCDHVFIRDRDLKAIKVDRVDIVLDKPMIKLASHEKVTVSDHAGVLVKISRI